MVYNGEINPSKRAYIMYLTQEKKLSIKDIARQCHVSRATAYRIKKDRIIDSYKREDWNRNLGGRPRKLSSREERKILRTLYSLRHEEGNFTSIRLMSRAGISPKHVSNRTVRRLLQRKDYHFLQARKKGLLSEKDSTKRLKFAKQMRKDYSKDVWKDIVAFYLDCVSCWYKRNPADQASVPYSCIWCKKCKGLIRGYTAKSGKVGSGGKVVKVVVAISYGKGAIVCHQYHKLDRAYFAEFVQDNFENMFRTANKNGSLLFLQDNCPVQNSVSARHPLRVKKAKQLKILPRSGDIHCIKKVFSCS